MDALDWQADLDRLKACYNAITNGETAAKCCTKAYETRHTIFGKLVCDLLTIGYNDDVPFEHIEDNFRTQLGSREYKSSNCSPDNYIFDAERKMLTIVDYKAVTTAEYINHTIDKYRHEFSSITKAYGYQLNVCIVHINPYTLQVWTNLSREFFRLDPDTIDFNPVKECTDIANAIIAEWGEDEEYQRSRSFESFNSTAPWVDVDPGFLLEQDPKYREFCESLPENVRDSFKRGLNTNLDSRNANFLALYNDSMNAHRPGVDAMIREQHAKVNSNTWADSITTCSEPTTQLLDESFNTLEQNLLETKQISTVFSDAKPSIHMLWSKDVQHVGMAADIDNFQRLNIIGGYLRLAITDPREPLDYFLMQVGATLDLANYRQSYTRAIEIQKAHSNGPRKPVLVNNSNVMHESQFILDQFTNKRAFLESCGIGIASKQGFKVATQDDTKVSKPFCLDPTSEDLKMATISSIEHATDILSNVSQKRYTKSCIDDYLQKIKESNAEFGSTIEDITQTDYYRCLFDMATLMKNALSVSEVTRRNTFRIVHCASNSTFLILLPSTSIKYQGSTICYISCTIHQDDIHYTGCEYKTYPISGTTFKVTVSKPIRLDKDRSRRLVEAPYLFLMIAGSYLCKKYPDVKSVLNYAFYCAINITKSLMTLTEPGRYIMMGASGLVSDVQSYIVDKFKPSIKTIFALYIYLKMRNGSMNAFNVLRNALTQKITVQNDEVITKGVSSVKNIPSLWFDCPVSLKDYLTEVFLPFYINSKGMHNYHHNIMQLAKVPCELEEMAKKNMVDFWQRSDKMFVDLNVFVYYVSEYYRTILKKTHQMRSNIEEKSKFTKPIYTIPTMTSSKSCTIVGKFETFKTPSSKVQQPQQSKRKKIIVPLSLRGIVTEHPRACFMKVPLNLMSYPCTITWCRRDFTTDYQTKKFPTFPRIISKYRRALEYRPSIKCLDHYEQTDLFVIVIDTTNPVAYMDELLRIFKLCDKSGYNEIALNVPDFMVEKIDQIVELAHNKQLYIPCANYQEENTIPSFETTNHSDLTTRIQYRHANYSDLKENIYDYTDAMTNKVFDELYKRSGIYGDNRFCDIAFTSIREKQQYYVTMFQKDQRTAVDREIYQMEFEGKLALYLLERIYKEYSRIDDTEMISQPGDTKILNMEQMRTKDTMFCYANTRDTDIEQQVFQYELNADMSKWSAQDITAKYLLVIAFDPSLHPNEKKHLVLFLCKYMQKKLILPDTVMSQLIDQKNAYGDHDPILTATSNLTRNTLEINQNWLQGNLNYLSSFVHSIAMRFYRETVTSFVKNAGGKCQVNNLVHSDDEQTSVCVALNKSAVNPKTNVALAKFVFDTLHFVMNKFGFQLNTKKTYVNTIIKEFVSMHNLNGEPFSIYQRFLMPCVGACSYSGPYEDLSARLSGIQTALRHGCPPSLAWLSIACATDMTYKTYNMLPGQTNDPCKHYTQKLRFELPLELGGFPIFDLGTFTILGAEAHDINLLSSLALKMRKLQVGSLSEDVVALCEAGCNDIQSLSPEEQWVLKYYQKFATCDLYDPDCSLGETYDMRQKSLITPKKFTTLKIINKLRSYVDHKSLSTDQKEDIINYILQNRHLLVTKAETAQEFEMLIKYRYFSRKFKESLSIQSAVQLFIEQTIYSRRKCIDKSFLETFDEEDFSELAQAQLVGKISFIDAFKKIDEIVSSQPQPDARHIFQIKLASDPVVIICANIQLYSTAVGNQPMVNMFAQKIPELRMMRTFVNTPATILRTWLSGKDIDDPILEIDVMAIKEFVAETGMLRLLERTQRQDESLSEYKKWTLATWTKILQTCYTYLSQVGFQNKAIMVPMRTTTQTEFLLSLYGSLRQDGVAWTLRIPFNPASYQKRSFINQSTNKDKQIANRYFRALTMFCDTYLEKDQRSAFICEVIDNCKYKGFELGYLYALLKQDERTRLEFMALLNCMDDLDDTDIKRFLANRDGVQTTWIVEQESRQMNQGPFQVLIETTNDTLAIQGEDNRLISVHLMRTPDSYKQGQDSYKRLILKELNRIFPSMSSFRTSPVIEQGYYLVLRFRTRQMPPTFDILYSDQIAKNTNLNAICKVTMGNKVKEIADVGTIRLLNMAKTSTRRYQITATHARNTRRAKLEMLHGTTGFVEVQGNIDMIELMNRTNLLTDVSEELTLPNVIEFAGLIKCNQDKNTIDIPTIVTEDVFSFEAECMDIDINFKSLFYQKKQGNTTIRRMLDERISKCLQYCSGVSSPRPETNLKVLILQNKLLSTLLQSLKHVSTDCDIYYSLLHLSTFPEGTHDTFHKEPMPPSYLTLRGYNYEKIVLLLSKPSILINTRINSVFQRCKKAIISYCNRKLEETRSIGMDDEDVEREFAAWGTASTKGGLFSFF